MELNLKDVQPSLSGPKRPHDRVSMKDLTLMKWKDKEGKQHRLRVVQSICPQWRYIGNLLDISDSVLESTLSHYI